jgi:hypothetical protein
MPAISKEFVGADNCAFFVRRFIFANGEAAVLIYILKFNGVFCPAFC